MRMRIGSYVLVLSFALGYLLGVPQQRRGPGADRFERSSPAVGESLPHLVAYDEKGDEFRLAELRGKHTVLVFGCLT